MTEKNTEGGVKMNRAKRAAMLGTGGVLAAILLGVGVTQANWVDASALSGVSFRSGNVDLQALSAPVTLNITSEGNNPLPGDTLRFSTPLDVAVEGSDLRVVAELKSTIPEGYSSRWRLVNTSGDEVIGWTEIDRSSGLRTEGVPSQLNGSKDFDLELEVTVPKEAEITEDGVSVEYDLQLRQPLRPGWSASTSSQGTSVDYSTVKYSLSYPEGERLSATAPKSLSTQLPDVVAASIARTGEAYLPLIHDLSISRGLKSSTAFTYESAAGVFMSDSTKLKLLQLSEGAKCEKDVTGAVLYDGIAKNLKSSPVELPVGSTDRNESISLCAVFTGSPVKDSSYKQSVTAEGVEPNGEVPSSGSTAEWSATIAPPDDGADLMVIGTHVSASR